MTDEEKKLEEERLLEEKKQKDLAEEERLKNLKIEEEEEEEFDWKADALKHRAIADRLKTKLSKVSPITKVSKEEHTIDDEIVQDVKVLKEERQKRQFGFDHKLSPEETDYAFKFSNGKPTKEVLEDPFFKGGLESLRAKKRLEENLPGSSSRSSIFVDKSFSELDEEGRKKAFDSKIKSLKQ